MSLQGLGEQCVEVNTADSAGRAAKTALDDVIGKSNGFKNLRALIRL